MLSGLVISSWSVFCRISSESRRMVRMGTRNRNTKVRLRARPCSWGFPPARFEKEKKMPASRRKNPMKVNPMGDAK